MDKKIYLSDLYDYYGLLFTDIQRKYFEDYHFNDLSLSEIAENYQVSRNAVFSQIKIVEEKLEFYEKALKLYEKKNKIKKIVETLDQKTQDSIMDLV